MSCGMTSQTSKSFSSWPAVYRWRWRNEDLMWQCVADIDRHWFRRHCGQNAAACNFGFYSCIWVQLLFIVVPAVDCGGKTCELVWACLSCMMLMLHALGMSFVPELRYFQMFKYSRILKAMCTFLGKVLFSTLFIPFPFFFCHESENMSNRTELQAHNEMMSKFNQSPSNLACLSGTRLLCEVRESPSNPTIPLAGWPWRIFYSDFSMVYNVDCTYLQ